MSPDAKPLLMEHMTVEDMRAALERTRTVLVPLGITEQHGYHLPLSTDTLIAGHVARETSARTGAVVAPALPHSYSGGRLPGTINVAPQVLALMVQEIVASLVEQGFRNVVLVLGHAGSENLRAIRDLVSMLLARCRHVPGLVVALAPVWEFSATVTQAFKDHDFHAGYVETSLMLHWEPGLVRTDRIVQDKPDVAASLREHQDNYQKIERLVDDEHVAPCVTQRDEIEVGVMGYPEKATAEAGRKIAEEYVTGLTALVKKIETGKRGKEKR